MSVGKNAIKRVMNDGYSSVKTSAPDMENSTVLANPAQEVVEKLVKPIEENTAKKAPAKTKKPTAKKTCTAKKAVNGEIDGFKKVSFGEDMPYYLL